MTNSFKGLSKILVLCSVTVFLISCGAEKNEVIELTEPAVETPDVYEINYFTGEVSLRTDCGEDDIHWEYEGIDGPDHWHELCENWDCDGNRQSPVNIIPPLKRNLAKSLAFYWKNTSTNIVNNGHTIQYNIDQPAVPTDGSYISLNGQKFYLLQFHLHAESEHTVNGKHYPVEIHFVHRNPLTGKLAVIGVFVEEGAANPFFNGMSDWPTEEGSFVAANAFNPSVLMPANFNDYKKAHFWYYDGSLTTPPCAEIVNWMVWSTNITASQDQIEAMKEILHENYRPTLPLGSRLVKAQ